MIKIVEVVFDRDYLFDKNLRLVGKVIKLKDNKDYPEGYKYRFQILYFKNNEWRQLIRVDNSLHFGKPHQHMHISNKVKKTNIKLENIKEHLMNLAKKLTKGEKNEDKSNR